MRYPELMLGLLGGLVLIEILMKKSLERKWSLSKRAVIQHPCLCSAVSQTLLRQRPRPGSPPARGHCCAAGPRKAAPRAWIPPEDLPLWGGLPQLRGKQRGGLVSTPWLCPGKEKVKPGGTGDLCDKTAPAGGSFVESVPICSASCL